MHFMSRVKINLVLFLILLILYSIFRIIFLGANHDFFLRINQTEILKSFLLGIRFDIAAVLMVNLPVLVLFNLPINSLKYKVIRVSLFIIFCLLNLTAFSLVFADWGYFPTTQKRMSFEIYSMLPDIIRMIPGLLHNYALLMIVYICFAILFIILTLKAVKSIYNHSETQLSLFKSTSWFVIVILFLIIGIRGGLQLKPIRINNAFFSDKKVLGYLTLNTPYSVLRSYFQYTLPQYEFMPARNAALITQAMLKADNEVLLDSNYIFLRQKKFDEKITKKNIVIFIMESWSAKFIGSITGGKTYTPFFDSLAQHGILFTKFLANGQRSIEAVPSILASLPAIFPQSIIGSRAEVSTVRGLGSILSEYNYTNSFHYGAKLGSMGFDSYVSSTGFSKYFSKDDFTSYDDSLDDGTWGVYDEPYFLDAAEKISDLSQPFCSVIFSLSSHDPFKIPSYREALFEKYVDESDFEKVLRYSDFSLQRFFNSAKRKKWFDNTIFIITADHTIYTERNNPLEMFHVPLLIYSNKDIQPKIITDVGSHTDILPTILDLLKISTVHASIGRSLLDNSTQPFCVQIVGPYYAYFDNQFLFLTNLEDDDELYDYTTVDFPQNDIINQNKAKAEELSLKLRAYIQTVTKAVNEDLIYRRK